jgi:hypothetical protein
MIVAEAVVEKTVLPYHALESRRAALPGTHRVNHPGFGRKSEDRVEVIWHQKKQLTPPALELLVTQHGRK